MDYHYLETLRNTHPAWRLLAADHAPLILSFLHKTYLQPNVRTLPQSELSTRLDDFLYHLREQLGDTAYPRQANDYLNDWASDERGWLRKFYPESGDEAHRDLWGHEPPANRFEGKLPNLDETEQSLFQDIKYNRLADDVRLEQERIGFEWLRKTLCKINEG